MEPGDRKEHEMRLLRLWHDILVDNRVTGYSWAQSVHDYRLAVLYSWMYVVIAVASLDPANERGMALFHAWFRRASAAMRDLAAGEMMPR
jgi:hypothetical protein